jgi:MFS family permease
MSLQTTALAEADEQINVPKPRRNRLPLYALFAANAISYIGDTLMLLAIPWFVLQTTGNVAKVGLTAACETSALILAALLGGRLVDSLGFKRASVVSDFASGIAVALIPLLYYTVGLAFWELLVLVFVAGLVTTPGGTARDVLTPDLAELAQMRMERATAAMDGISRVSRFFGAPLAGVMIAFVGSGNLLWLDAASFIVSALLIGLLVPGRRTLAKHSQAANQSGEAQATKEAEAGLEASTSYLSGLREGIRFLGRDQLLLSIILTVLVTNLLDAGFGSVLAPAYIKQVFGSAVLLGSIIAAFGGAAFIGTVVFGAVGHRLPRRETLGIGFTLGGATRYLTLALVPFAPVLVAVSAFAGFCIGPVNPLFSTVAYERIPTRMRARVFGVMSAGAMAGTPLGALLSGVLASWLGIRPVLLIFGACYMIATLSLLVNPALRAMEQPKTVQSKR